jgi:hypothetical protein
MKIEAKSFVQKLIDEKKLEAANEDKKALFENEYLTSPDKAAKMAELLTPIIASTAKIGGVQNMNNTTFAGHETSPLGSIVPLGIAKLNENVQPFN